MKIIKTSDYQSYVEPTAEQLRSQANTVKNTANALDSIIQADEGAPFMDSEDFKAMLKARSSCKFLMEQISEKLEKLQF